LKLNFSGEELGEEDRKYFAYELTNHRFAKYLKDAKLHVKQYKKTGFRRKTALNLLAKTNFGKINVEADSWQFNKAVQKLIKKIEKFLIRNEEKNKAHRIFKKRFALLKKRKNNLNKN